ncbi:MAG: hypothetical protein AAF921_25030, partial [Cyanobacteria bacterium P01_D01_bin.44]
VEDSPKPVEDLPQGPGTGFTFLYYFASTSLVGTLLASQVLHVSLSTGIPNQIGVVLGVVGGAVGTYFNRSQTLNLPVKGKKELLNRINPILADMGYTLDETLEDPAEGLIYQRSGLRAWLSGKVYVTLGQKQATLTSRAVHIRTLQKHLK